MKALCERLHHNQKQKLLLVIAHMLIKEVGDGRVGDETIGAFDQVVAFILKAQVLNGYLALAQGRDDLFGLANWYARVVGAMHDKEGCGDAVDGANGRDLLKKLAVLLQAAVLSLAQFTAPWTGILQESDKVSDPNDVNARRPQIRIGRESREHHKAAIAAAHNGNTTRISDAAITQVENCVLEICDGIHAQTHIIQALVLITITGAAPHIWYKDSIATSDKILNYGIEDRTRLALRTTMDVDNHR